jgi:hypothetical protein
MAQPSRDGQEPSALTRPWASIATRASMHSRPTPATSIFRRALIGSNGGTPKLRWQRQQQRSSLETKSPGAARTGPLPAPSLDFWLSLLGLPASVPVLGKLITIIAASNFRYRQAGLKFRQCTNLLQHLRGIISAPQLASQGGSFSRQEPPRSYVS